MSKTPVLFVHSATDPPLGADVRVHALIMRGLDRSEFDVHVACAFGTESAPTPTYEAVARIPHVSMRRLNLGRELFGRSRLGKLLALLRTVPALWNLVALARYVRRHDIRIVHASDRPRDAAAAVLLAKLTGIRCVVHVHVEYGAWMSRLLRASLARADALIGVSEFVVRSLVSGGLPAQRAHAVLNAIEPGAWNPRLDGGPTRASLGIPAAAQVVITIARVMRAKGHVELLRAFAAVRSEFPRLVLLVVGQDYPAGSSHTAELRALATELGVEKDVLFLGQRRDVASLLAASDVFALPSFGEPFGLAHAEAMAMKRPVVALRSGGTPEVVEHLKSGLLSDPGDVGALAAHLAELLRDAALRAHMGEHGRTQVESRFAQERLSRETAAVYRSLLASRASR